MDVPVKSKHDGVKICNPQKRLLTVQEVSNCYKERFIITGYRRPYSSVLQCVCSILEVHNETFNIWTHFLPFLIFLVYFMCYFPSGLWPIENISTQYYPLLAMEISVLTFLLGSSVAHTFNCMTPKIRHICFYIDYAAISTFGIGGSCATFFYLRPTNTTFFIYNSPSLYMIGTVLINAIQVFGNCASRHTCDRHKYKIRTLLFVLVFLYGNFPNLHRGFMCIMGNLEECPSSASWFILDYFFYTLSAVLNVARVPERYFPYMFDILGHNHQWVHVFTILGTLAHFQTTLVEMEARKSQLPLLMAGLSGWNSVGSVFVMFAAGLSIAALFAKLLTPDGHLKSL